MGRHRIVSLVLCLAILLSNALPFGGYEGAGRHASVLADRSNAGITVASQALGSRLVSVPLASTLHAAAPGSLPIGPALDRALRVPSAGTSPPLVFLCQTPAGCRPPPHS